MPTLNDLINRVLGHLDQFTTNRPTTATFTAWDATQGIRIEDLSQPLVNALAELETGELVHIGSYDPASSAVSTPAWFRGQLGTPQNDTVTVGSKVVIEPLWPKFHVAQALCDGINRLYPALFGIREVTLTTSSINGNYELPNDVVGIARVSYTEFGPSEAQSGLWSWRLDTSNPDGKRYFRTSLLPAGRTLTLTCRTKPVTPAATAYTSDWSLTGLQPSHADLPVLYATSVLLPSADASRLQSRSVEQSDRNKYIQSGSANAASRRYMEMFDRALANERATLLELYPPLAHKELG